MPVLLPEGCELHASFEGDVVAVRVLDGGGEEEEQGHGGPRRREGGIPGAGAAGEAVRDNGAKADGVVQLQFSATLGDRFGEQELLANVLTAAPIET